MARKLKIMENETHPLEDLKNDEITKTLKNEKCTLKDLEYKYTLKDLEYG